MIPWAKLNETVIKIYGNTISIKKKSLINKENIIMRN